MHKPHIERWYDDNKVVIDDLIEHVIQKLKQDTMLPNFIAYEFSYDWEKLRNELVEYLYVSKYGTRSIA